MLDVFFISELIASNRGDGGAALCHGREQRLLTPDEKKEREETCADVNSPDSPFQSCVMRDSPARSFNEGKKREESKFTNDDGASDDNSDGECRTACPICPGDLSSGARASFGMHCGMAPFRSTRKG